jgi:hypothetical protein
MIPDPKGWIQVEKLQSFSLINILVPEVYF